MTAPRKPRSSTRTSSPPNSSDLSPKSSDVSLPPDDPLADLLLVRLLAKGRAPTVAKLTSDLAPFFRLPPDADRIVSSARALAARGELSEDAFVPTERGRKRAMGWLGITEADLGAKATWADIKSRLLPARALGLSRKEASALMRSKPKLTARLLARALALPESKDQTIALVLEAHTCAMLGHPECDTLDALMRAVCSRTLGAEGVLSSKELATQAPRVLLGAGKAGFRGTPAQLRDLLLSGFADARTEAPASVDLSDLSAFAAFVSTEAARCETGRFGDDKVFISSLWERLCALPALAAKGSDHFKERLVEANAAGLLSLGRADLVQRMDPEVVARSETRTRGGVFHFVVAGRHL